VLRTPEGRLLTLVRLLLLEAVLMAGLAVVLVIALATSRRSTEVGFTIAEIGLSLLVAAGLALMARGVWEGKRWPRSPAITLQLVGLPISGRLFEFGGWWLGVPMVLILLATLVLLFATMPRPPEPGSEQPGSEQAADPDAE
jgi:hypothetical protein